MVTRVDTRGGGRLAGRGDRTGGRAGPSDDVPTIQHRPPAVRDIDTLRLELRPVEASDARTVLAGRVPQGLELAPGYPSQFSLDVLSLAAAGPSAHDVGPFFIIRRADLALVGEIGCRINQLTKTAHVGYTIAEPCWNLGYATEALHALLGYLLDEVGVPRVEAETLADHIASRRVMEKSGMRVCGRRRGGDGGPPVELVRYEAVAGLWSPSPRPLTRPRNGRKHRGRRLRIDPA